MTANPIPDVPPASITVLIIDDEVNHAEAMRETLARVTELNGRGKLRAVVLTHSHADHAGGAGLLQQATGCEVWAGPRTHNPRLEQQERQLQLKPRAYEVSRELADGETIDLGYDALRVLRTPGHSDDHLVLLLEGEGVMFCGDLFTHGDVGTLDITRSHRVALDLIFRSVRRCAAIGPRELRPGHGPLLRRPARLFTTAEKRFRLFRNNPSILVAHTLMPLLLLLLEAREGASTTELAAYVRTHAPFFRDFLDGAGEDTLAHELGKILMILEMKGLIATTGGRVVLRGDALHAGI